MRALIIRYPTSSQVIPILGSAQIVMIFESLMMAAMATHHYLVRSTPQSSMLKFQQPQRIKISPPSLAEEGWGMRAFSEQSSVSLSRINSRLQKTGFNGIQDFEIYHYFLVQNTQWY
jgi:hypothetical protein